MIAISVSLLTWNLFISSLIRTIALSYALQIVSFAFWMSFILFTCMTTVTLMSSHNIKPVPKSVFHLPTKWHHSRTEQQRVLIVGLSWQSIYIYKTTSQQPYIIHHVVKSCHHRIGERRQDFRDFCGSCGFALCLWRIFFFGCHELWKFFFIDPGKWQQWRLQMLVQRRQNNLQHLNMRQDGEIVVKLWWKVDEQDKTRIERNKCDISTRESSRLNVEEQLEEILRELNKKKRRNNRHISHPTWHHNTTRVES